MTDAGLQADDPADVAVAPAAEPEPADVTAVPRPPSTRPPM